MKVTMHDIEQHSPDRLMPPVSRECAPAYWQAVEAGEHSAKNVDALFVGLCRNSMPQIQLNTQRLERLGERFKSWRAFIYENDSEDGTAEHLRSWAAGRDNVEVRTERHARPQLSTEKTARRTNALAEYRNVCREWASRQTSDAVQRIFVIDFDTWGGWSDDGVMTGIYWLEQLPGAAGMASVSTIDLAFPQHPDGKVRIHYDAWAFRLNHWAEHDMTWFPYWWPPVGSHPVACHSAFGGMAIYRPEAFFAGTYSGGDCEHVSFHRTIYEATSMRMWLNPSQRMVMNWISEPAEC
jgi:hypothetical protein